MSTVATGLTGPQTTGGSSSGGDTFGNVFTDAVTAIGAYIARSRAAELATVGAEDAGITATDVAIASVAAVPGLLTGDIAGSIAGGAAALGVGLTALDPLTAPFVAVAALYLADQGTESLLKDLQRLAGGKSPQPSQRRPVRSYSNYSGTTSEVVTNTADWESATVTGHVSETSADNHFARTFKGKSSNGATTLYQQSAGTYKWLYPDLPTTKTLRFPSFIVFSQALTAYANRKECAQGYRGLQSSGRSGQRRAPGRGIPRPDSSRS